jgi:hypothetical protein
VNQARDWQRRADAKLEPYRGDEASPDTMPEDVHRDAVAREAIPPYFALMDAAVTGPGGTVAIPFVRVRTASVAAWWIGVFDLDGA